MDSGIRVMVARGDDATQELRLADELGLGVADPGPGNRAALLVRRGGRLALAFPEDGFKSSCCVEFGSAEVLRRLREARSQPLARAVGASPRRIVDATAGLGRDAATLAAAGHAVVLLERDPVLWALLRDGLARALADPRTARIAARMTLVHADARTWLAGLAASERPEVVYLDPMYPEKRKAALAKREMQVLQTLLGTTGDEHELAARATQVATRRVVVKRPLRAPALLEAVHHVVASKLVRFDVYETNT